MTGDPRYAELLAHHTLVMALPGVVPMCVLVGTFVAIVVADRRKHRHDVGGEDGPDAGPAEGPEVVDTDRQEDGRAATDRAA